MATVIKGTLERRPRDTVYPWPEWLDGKQREIRKGADYSASDSSMRAMIYRMGLAANMRVASYLVKPGVIRFQAHSK